VKSVLPAAVLLDDAEEDTTDPQQCRHLAEAGALVVLSLPRHVLTRGRRLEADLDPAWARVADVILEVRTRRLRPRYRSQVGEADLHLLRNRHGRTTTAAVAFQGHYARFADVTRADA
jgi:replicative DNA helicase